MKSVRVALILLMLAVLTFGASKEVREKIAKGRTQMNRGRFEQAEKIFREALQLDPSHIPAQVLIGDSLFLQKRYTAAAEEYEKARALEARHHQLIQDEQRSLWNQLGAAYVYAAQYDQAKQVFHEAIQHDPDYAFFHYNLACAYAEAGDLDGAIPHLRAAWQRRKNLLPGQSFPDPRSDSSFARWVNDSRFQDAVREMVF